LWKASCVACRQPRGNLFERFRFLDLRRDQRRRLVKGHRYQAADLRKRPEILAGSANCPQAAHELDADVSANLL